MSATPHLACRWSSTAAGTPVLPDGCADVVWDGHRLVVAGPATAPTLGAARAGDAITGVRFRVGAAGLALGLPAAELRDRTVELADVWGRDGARLAERVGSAAPSERSAVLAAAVEARVRGAPPPDPAVEAAVRAVARMVAGAPPGGLASRGSVGGRPSRRGRC